METMLADHVSDFGRAYHVQSDTVDGNDVESVMISARDAVAYVRKYRKPFLLETYTYRLRGHMEPDDQSYVNPHELEAWRKKDPITTMEARLGLSENETRAMRERVQQVVEDAAEFAMNSPYPSFDELTTDVYA
jgi:acetoin:2,6-dichlorophenolindophenol oxidoreductase subunit alpha